MRALLGPSRVVADHTWPEWREALVLELADADGTRWFLKRHRGNERYRAELTAYRRWVPALGDAAPMLVDADEESQSLVISAIPGQRPEDWSSPRLQHQAGRLLRSLHDAEDLGGWDDMAAAKAAVLDYWAARGRGLVEPHLVGACSSPVEDPGGSPAASAGALPLRLQPPELARGG